MRQFLVLLFLYITALLPAQVGITGRKANVDSLEKVLAKSREDTSKVDVLNMLAIEYRLSDPDKAAITAVQAFSLAEKLNYARGMMSACNQLGIIYKNRSEFDKALGYYQKGLEIGKRSGLKLLSAKISANMGSIYSHQGNFPKALENYVSALENFIALKDKRAIGACESNIGIIYSRMKKNEIALEYYKKALAIRTELNDQLGIANDYSNIAIEYMLMADKTGKVSDYDTALFYFGRSLKMLEDLGDKQGVAHSLNNMARVFIDLGKIKLPVPGG